MKMWVSCGWIAAGSVLLACGGCGFKGPLYLPDRNATVVTHPAQAPQTAGEQGATAQGAAPAGQTQTPAPAGKNRGKGAPPSNSAPQNPPQSPPPPQ